MSHFTTLVLGDNPEEMLAPFDENIEVEPRIDDSRKWEDDLSSAKERIEKYRREAGSHGIPEPDADDREILQWWSGGGWRRRDNGEGFDYWTTYNPDSQWDWYQIGGRWNNMLVTRAGERVNSCTVDELDIAATWPDPDGGTVFAFLDEEGWHEKGSMGWWGIVRDPKDQSDWNAQVIERLKNADPNTKVTLFDLHI